MQHIIDRKRQPIRPVLVRSAMPLATTLLLAATLGVVNVREQQSLNVMRSELDSLAVVEARATELRLQLLASKTKLTQLEKLAAQNGLQPKTLLGKAAVANARLAYAQFQEKFSGPRWQKLADAGALRSRRALAFSGPAGAYINFWPGAS